MTQKKYTDGSGVSEIWANTKNYIAAQLLGKSNVGHTHNYAGSSNAGGAASSTLKLETYKQGSTTETYGANYPIFAQWVDGSNVALKCTNYTVCVDKANSVAWGNVSGKPSFATVATSGSYNDLSNKPTIPTVNNGTLTIQQNGVNVQTFTANQSGNVTANIVTPAVNDGTLTIMVDGITAGTFTANQSTDTIVALTSGGGSSADLLPIGSYIQFAGSQAPAGFLVCNGGAISRTTYSQLFAVIGTTYGSGDGSTTFNLPNLTDRFLQGSTTSGTVINAGLPNITGSFVPRVYGSYAKKRSQGAFFGKDSTSDLSSNGGTYEGNASIHFDASRSNSIYGKSSTVQPPALTCLICIKY